MVSQTIFFLWCKFILIHYWYSCIESMVLHIVYTFVFAKWHLLNFVCNFDYNFQHLGRNYRKPINWRISNYQQNYRYHWKTSSNYRLNDRYQKWQEIYRKFIVIVKNDLSPTPMQQWENRNCHQGRYTTFSTRAACQFIVILLSYSSLLFLFLDYHYQPNHTKITQGILYHTKEPHKKETNQGLKSAVGSPYKLF